MTTAPAPSKERRWFMPSIAALIVAALVVTGAAFGMSPGRRTESPQWPNLSTGVSAVACDDTLLINGEFTRAVQDATLSGNYDGVKKFGFPAPAKVEELTNLQHTWRALQIQLDIKAGTVADGTCVDGANGNGTPTTGPCPEQFVQHFDPNVKGRFVSGGVKNSGEILAAVARDARYLAFIAYRLGLQPDVSADKLLAPDNKCLSREGQDMFRQVKDALTNGDVEINENDEVPANYFNTGMVTGRPVVDQSPGIGGDRSAVSFTNKKTGKKLYVMKRCGNVGCENQHGLPPGQTEHGRPPGSTPPPPPETTTPPTSPPTTSTCTNGGTPPKCLEAKDPNAGAGHQGNVPTQVQGPNPPAPTTAEPRPSDPPKSTSAPHTTQPAPTRTSTPVIESPAPQPSAPATGTHCPPGIPEC
jgi:hypothetical protein